LRHVNPEEAERIIYKAAGEDSNARKQASVEQKESQQQGLLNALPPFTQSLASH
jgi:hypothetical protein